MRWAAIAVPRRLSPLRSTFTGNLAPYGGAFSNGQGGTARLSNVTVSGNETDPTSFYGAAVGSGSTSRPRYVLQFGQTWCGRFGR